MGEAVVGGLPAGAGVEAFAPEAGELIDLLVRSAVLHDGFEVDEAVGVELFQGAIDLLMRRRPEVTDRPIELLRNFITGAGPFGQGNHDRILQRHTCTVAVHYVAMQQGS